MYMLLNLAVGDSGSWPGRYDASMRSFRILGATGLRWVAGMTT
jgi:hypothetical protein